MDAKLSLQKNCASNLILHPNFNAQRLNCTEHWHKQISQIPQDGVVARQRAHLLGWHARWSSTPSQHVTLGLQAFSSESHSTGSINKHSKSYHVMTSSQALTVMEMRDEIQRIRDQLFFFFCARPISADDFEAAFQHEKSLWLQCI